MNIAVIGTGNVGGAIIRELSNKKHRIFMGVRDTQKLEVKELIKENVTAHSVENAIKAAEIIIIAVHPPALKDVCDNIGKTDKVIIDATNTIVKKPEGYDDGSSAIKDWTGSNNVVKAFNTTGANLIGNTKFGDRTTPTYIASDSSTAKNVASEIAKDLGFREAIDCGGLENAKILETLASVWVGLAMKSGMGREIAFDLLRR